MNEKKNSPKKNYNIGIQIAKSGSRGWGCSWVAEHLLSMYKDPGWNPPKDEGRKETYYTGSAGLAQMKGYAWHSAGYLQLTTTELCGNHCLSHKEKTIR